MHRSTSFFFLFMTLLLACFPAACLDAGPGAEEETAVETAAIGTGEQCDTAPADSTFPSGAPHLYVSSPSYGHAECSSAYLVDLYTYQVPGAFPGTYLSWADAEPTSQFACAGAALSVYVWDITTEPHVFKGALTSKGTWVDNPDQGLNPGSAKLCQILPIRVEDGIQLSPDRWYRFAIRASVTMIGVFNRGFVLASAPLPGRTGPGAVGSLSDGWYTAMIASSGADMNDPYPWPTSSHQLRLSMSNARVTRGGDIVFQDGQFLNPSRSYTKLGHPNFGLSNASVEFVGTADLNAFTCPALEIQPDSTFPPEYTYNKWSPGAPIFTGGGYCVLNAENNYVHRMEVMRADPAKQLLVVRYTIDEITNRLAHGCDDGFCDAQVQVASQFMRRGTLHHDMTATTFDVLHQARACIESNLQRTLPVPLSMVLHGESTNPPFPLGGSSYGQSDIMIYSAGFQGIIQPGDKQVEHEEDVRFELHETMHVYNHHLFSGNRPIWFEEGMAVQIGTRLTCGGNPRLLSDVWRSWSPGTTSPQEVGSELFRRLEVDHGCDVSCAADIWRSLVDDHGADPDITSAEIRAAMEARVGANLEGLFATLGILD